MLIRFSELACKEVINLCNGARLGYVTDMELEEGGQIRTLIVPCSGKCFGLLPSPGDYVIPWNCIRRIGGDLILVDADPDECRRGREKPKKFF